MDNGGSYAIRGFNFQKASIIHVAIQNFDSGNIEIIPEGKDDFDVNLDGTKYYVQTKITKQSIATITRKGTKGDKKSIIEKNFSSDDTESSNYCIFTPLDMFSDKGKLNRKDDFVLCSPVYQVKEEKIQEIITRINSTLYGKSQLESKLRRFNMHETPFPGDLEIAEYTLIGLMVKKNILVDGSKGRLGISEICLSIDQKSEKLYEETNNHKKIINTEYLKNIFTTVNYMQKFDDFLNAMGYNSIIRSKIKSHRNMIEVLYSETKHKIKLALEDIEYDIRWEEAKIVDVIKKYVLVQCIVDISINWYLLNAMIIEAVIEKEV